MTIGTINLGDGPAEQQEREPMLLLDRTGSMHYGTSATNTTSRHATIGEALGIVVERLAAQDSQGENEAGGGGLRTVTFADGRAEDIGDLNPSNFAHKWGQISWRGGTYIVPGFREIQRVYAKEFGLRPKDEQPALLALIITDGEAEDTETFTHLLNSAVSTNDNLYVEIAIIGYGTEHDQALARYREIASANMHVKVTSLAGETNPETIAATLLRMIE